MSDFTIHSAETAPGDAQRILTGSKRSLGFVPNLLGILANSPTALKAYTQIAGLLDKSSLSPTELQVVLIAASVENNCEYCVAAHSAIARAQKLPPDVIDAVRNRDALADAKLEALRQFTRAVVVQRGLVGMEEREAFFAAGYGPEQVLDVITGVAMKTISNYTNHLASTPLDDAFQATSWTLEDAA